MVNRAIRYILILYIITISNFCFAENSDNLLHKQEEINKCNSNTQKINFNYFTDNKVITTNFVEKSTKSVENIISVTLFSNYVNDSFKIFICNPSNYNEFRDIGYPVVFYLDGNVTSRHTVIQDLCDQGQIPEVISVSIGYTGATMRNRDYTYSYSNFYYFLKNELIPYIENHYNTDKNYHTLFGHSYGGLCGFNFIFGKFAESNFPFKNVISASPSLGWPDFYVDDYCRQLESSYFENYKSLPINLYMTMGSLESTEYYIAYFNSMSYTIINRRYNGLNFNNVLNAGKTHGTNIGPSLRDGLIWVFSKFQNIPVSPPNIVSISKKLIKEIGISPNPSTGIFNINIIEASTKNAKVKIYDFSGKLILSKAFENGVFDLTGYKKGIYVAKISLGDKVMCEKIFIK